MATVMVCVPWAYANVCPSNVNAQVVPWMVAWWATPLIVKAIWTAAFGFETSNVPDKTISSSKIFWVIVPTSWMVTAVVKGLGEIGARSAFGKCPSSDLAMPTTEAAAPPIIASLVPAVAYQGVLTTSAISLTVGTASLISVGLKGLLMSAKYSKSFAGYATGCTL